MSACLGNEILVFVTNKPETSPTVAALPSTWPMFRIERCEAGRLGGIARPAHKQMVEINLSGAADDLNPIPIESPWARSADTFTA
jgi:hypothetical protein